MLEKIDFEIWLEIFFGRNFRKIEKSKIENFTLKFFENRKFKISKIFNIDFLKKFSIFFMIFFEIHLRLELYPKMKTRNAESATRARQVRTRSIYQESSIYATTDNKNNIIIGFVCIKKMRNYM